jgi:hypothetical protein
MSPAGVSGLGIGRCDHCINRASDVLGSAVGIGLAGIKPGNDGFQCHGRYEPGRPISKWTIRDREVALGDVDRGGPDRVDNVAEMVRYARTDLDIDGVAIKAGDLVLLEIGGGNHDPTVFANPDRVDVTRHAATRLAFGYGARYCIGAPLARIELQTVFSQLVSPFPTLKLAADVEELVVLTRGLIALPVRW